MRSWVRVFFFFSIFSKLWPAHKDPFIFSFRNDFHLRPWPFELKHFYFQGGNSRDLTALGLFSHSHLFYIKKKKKRNEMSYWGSVYTRTFGVQPLSEGRKKRVPMFYLGRGGPTLVDPRRRIFNKNKKKKGKCVSVSYFFVFLFFVFKKGKMEFIALIEGNHRHTYTLKKSTGKISTQKWWTWFSPNLMSICRQQEENEEKTRKTARDKFCDNFYYILLSVFCFFLNASHFFFFFSNIKMRFHRKCSTSVHQLSPTREAVGPSVFFLLLLPMR